MFARRKANACQLCVASKPDENERLSKLYESSSGGERKKAEVVEEEEEVVSCSDEKTGFLNPRQDFVFLEDEEGNWQVRYRANIVSSHDHDRGVTLQATTLCLVCRSVVFNFVNEQGLEATKAARLSLAARGLFTGEKRRGILTAARRIEKAKSQWWLKVQREMEERDARQQADARADAALKARQEEENCLKAEAEEKVVSEHRRREQKRHVEMVQRSVDCFSKWMHQDQDEGKRVLATKQLFSALSKEREYGVTVHASTKRNHPLDTTRRQVGLQGVPEDQLAPSRHVESKRATDATLPLTCEAAAKAFGSPEEQAKHRRDQDDGAAQLAKDKARRKELHRFKKMAVNRERLTRTRDEVKAAQNDWIERAEMAKTIAEFETLRNRYDEEAKRRELAEAERQLMVKEDYLSKRMKQRWRREEIQREAAARNERLRARELELQRIKALELHREMSERRQLQQCEIGQCSFGDTFWGVDCESARLNALEAERQRIFALRTQKMHAVMVCSGNVAGDPDDEAKEDPMTTWLELQVI